MRFAIALLAVTGAVSAFQNQVAPQTPNPAHLFTRQLGAGACASVDITITSQDVCTLAGLTASICAVPGVIPTAINTVVNTLTPLLTPVVTLCECATATGLTPDSLVRFNNFYNSRIAGDVVAVATINTALNTLLNGLTVRTLLQNGIIADITQSPTKCPLPPANSVATCSTTCGFTCNTGYINCDGVSCTTGSVCPSSARRRRRAVANDLLCETGLTACAIPGNMYAFECLNTVTNVESCGGCIFALPGGKRGEDCTAKPGVLDVACIADKCVASSCTKGFVLNGTECVNPEAGSIVEDAKDLVGGVGRLFVNGAGNVVRRNAKEIIQARQATAELLKVKAAKR